MQLAHLIPHLDAEIARLQRARDLLAFVPESQDFSTSPATEPAISEKLSTTAPVLNHVAEPTAADPAMHLKSAPSSAGFTRERRVRAAGEETRQRRRRRSPVEDTALRGTVPSGPIVVSAAEVRKSQAAKSAEVSRAAELKYAGAESVSSFGMGRRSSDRASADSMLQKLIHLGEADADHGSAG